MASKNRAALINKVLKVVRKHYKPAAPTKDRSLLEHLLFACCLENSSHDAAERVFQSLSSDYFDWNEVRVSTIRELAEALKPLADPQEAAMRVKRVLQSVFETHYSFDLEPLKKQNIGAAVKQIEKYNGSTPFAAAYVTQQALGGHAIPVNRGLLHAMRMVGVVSDAEAAKRVVPGLERAAPKSKGAEMGSLLHQLGVEMYRSPYGPTIRKLLLEIEPSSQLPKRPTKSEEPRPAPAPSPAAAAATPAGKSAERLAASKKAVGKKAVAEAAPAAKAPPAKKVKKVLKKPQKPTPTVKKKSTAAAGKRLTKRKPR